MPEITLDPDFTGCTEPRAMWLGHASTAVQLPPLEEGGQAFTVLFDTIASKRCSPIKWLGPVRRTPFRCTIASMGKIDLVALSHDHHDHCDPSTILEIEKCNNGTTRYAVPTGMGKLLRGMGIDSSRIEEMEWWEEIVIGRDGKVKRRKALSEPELSGPIGLPAYGTSDVLEKIGVKLDDLPPAMNTYLVEVETERADTIEPVPHLLYDGNGDTKCGTDSLGATADNQKDFLLREEREETEDVGQPLPMEEGEIKLVCTPSQHNSGRSLFSRNQTGWSSWLLESAQPNDTRWKCFFGGDTGYCSRPSGPTCPAFSQVHERYGSPNISFLPISVGAVLPYITKLTCGLVRISGDIARHIHATPGDAVGMHDALRSLLSYGIHWGTWSTSKGARESARELRTAVASSKTNRPFEVPCIGRWISRTSLIGVEA